MPKMKSAAVLQKYFGQRPKTETVDLATEQFTALPYEAKVEAGGLKGFMVELSRLSPEEKLELARMAVKAMREAGEDVELDETPS